MCVSVRVCISLGPLGWLSTLNFSNTSKQVPGRRCENARRERKRKKKRQNTHQHARTRATRLGLNPTDQIVAASHLRCRFVQLFQLPSSMHYFIITIFVIIEPPLYHEFFKFAWYNE